MPTQVAHASEAELIVISKPKSERISNLLGFGGFGILCMFAERAVNPKYFWVPIAFGILCILWAIITSGPAEIKLDPHSETIAVATGPLLLSRTVRGSVSDIESLVFKVRSIRTYGVAVLSGPITVLSVRIKWKSPRRKSCVVSNLPEDDSYSAMRAIKERMDVVVRWED